MDKQHLHDPEFERWPPPASAAAADADLPGWGVAIARGILGRCPRCGETSIFNGYLKVNAICIACGAPLGQFPADDTPPYVAMIVVLHIVALFVIFAVHGNYLPGPAMALLLLLALALICMAVLRLAKGAVIGILLKLGMKREPLRG